MDDRFCLVTTTTDTPELARSIARALLDQKLAACVQISPVVSHYLWDGALHEEAEQHLSIKAKSADYPAIAASIRSLHTYEVPEILRFDIADGSPDYLSWIKSVTS